MFKIRFISWSLLFFLILGCSSAPRYRGGASTYKQRLKNQKEMSRVATRKEWKVGDTFTGIASYYGKDFHGKLTANGEYFDMYGITAAHKTLPFNTVIRVTNLENNKSLLVRINDRGPYVKGRVLDLSYGAALKLGFVDKGTTRIKAEIIELGDNQYMKHVDN